MKITFFDGSTTSVDADGKRATFKKGVFSTKVSVRPPTVEDALALNIAAISTRIETCKLDELTLVVSELDRVEQIYERWMKDERRSW